MKKILIFLILAISILPVFSQKATYYRTEAFGSMASGDHTPFWIVNQNWGMTSLEPGNFYLRGGVFHEQQLNPECSFRAGIDLVGGNDSPYGNVWVQQLYGQLNWRVLRLDVGSREDYISPLNPSLSSGDFIQSNNSRPIPEVKISLPDFWTVPGTRDMISLKGHFAIGKYLEDDWMKDRSQPVLENFATDVLTHHKSLFFRIGEIKKDSRQLLIGLQHYAHWGGTYHKYIKREEGWRWEIFNQSTSLEDFVRMVFAQEGSSKSSLTDQAHMAGSQWGAYFVGYDWLIQKKKVRAYMQHFFEDGSGMGFQNYRDNLLGIEYQSDQPDLLSGLVFEYVYTKQQTGAIHFNNDMQDEYQYLYKKGNGNDNYYHHVDYTQGPSYFGRTLGTPLLLSPGYNTDGSPSFKSSRILSFHLGAEGYLLPELQYRIMLTTGQSWGRYYHPFRQVKEGFSSMMELKYNFPGTADWKAKLMLGYDQGEFFGGDTFGASISIVKSGRIFK
ncbi:capsule assembly Wzi family protein [Bacteroidales bacterium OttesenSCG-928-J19]|nr:capsule assembly Wzi family protein [Bacteroidales bacterium OttesenSCG-928-J19]